MIYLYLYYLIFILYYVSVSILQFTFGCQNVFLNKPLIIIINNNNTSDSNFKKIQLIQNCAARLITGVPKYDHISPTLNALGWLPIKEHLLYRDALLTFKCMNDKAPQYLCDNFEQRNRIHNRDTRRNGELCMRVQLCKYGEIQSAINQR